MTANNPVERLIRYVRSVVTDSKYGSDPEWVRMNLGADHMRCTANSDSPVEAPSGPYMRPFHRPYPGLPDLFHTYCSDHPDFAYCGTRNAAENAIREHLGVAHSRSRATGPDMNDTHRWVNIARERRDEVTLTCSCGMVWKRIPLVRGGDTFIPRCPNERTAL